MKVIDLLNKIANGEEAPKEFKFNSENYKLKNGKYLDESNDSILFNINYDLSNLNDKIEILEEPKGIPEKISNNFHYIGVEEILADKINKIIDYLKSKGE